MINTTKEIENYLEDKLWRKNENANVIKSLGALEGYLSAKVFSDYWIKKLSKKERSLHENGFIHIHDLAKPICPYCFGISAFDIAIKGVNSINSNTVTTRPAKYLSTFINHIVNIVGILSNELGGAVAMNNVSTIVAPFIREEKLSHEEVKRCVQSLIYGLNQPSRWSGQAPFSNISICLNPAPQYKDEYCIVGGNVLSYKYADCQKELDLFNDILIDVLMKGDAGGKVFTFPIVSIQVTKNFDWNSNITNKIFESNKKYGLYYFENFINSDKDLKNSRSMCCRLSLRINELQHVGGIFGNTSGTGSMGVVTINLNRLGYLYRGHKKDFFEHLDKLFYSALNILDKKREIVTKIFDGGYFPYLANYIKNFKTFFNTISVAGSHECCVNYFSNADGIMSKEGKKFIITVLRYLSRKIRKEMLSRGVAINLEAAPIEGASYRLAKKDLELCPKIYTSGTKKRPYLHSGALNPQSEKNLLDIIDNQKDIQHLFSGGSVNHFWLGEKLNSGESIKVFLKKLFTLTKIPYVSFNPTFSICLEHGYISGEHFTCPTCGKNCLVYSRVVGYLKPVSLGGKIDRENGKFTTKNPTWNVGKLQEWVDRHLIDEKDLKYL